MTEKKDYIEVGKIVRLFHQKGCIGIKVETNGLKKGDKLLLETNRNKRQDLTVTVNSIQIDHEFVTEVKPGNTCAIAVPHNPDKIDRFPHCGMSVFIIPEKKDNEKDCPSTRTINNTEEGYPPQAPVMDVDDLDLAP